MQRVSFTEKDYMYNKTATIWGRRKVCTHSDVGSHIEMAELITTDAHVWTVLPGIATQLVSRVSSRFKLGAQAITACVTRIHYVANLSKPRWNVPLWRDLAQAAPGSSCTHTASLSFPHRIGFLRLRFGDSACCDSTRRGFGIAGSILLCCMGLRQCWK